MSSAYQFKRDATEGINEISTWLSLQKLFVVEFVIVGTGFTTKGIEKFGPIQFPAFGVTTYVIEAKFKVVFTSVCAMFFCPTA